MRCPRFQTVALLGLWVSVQAGETGVLAADVPDLILHHGRIVTVDASFRIAEAIAVRGERIIAVGSNEEIGKLAGSATKSIDLGGKTVLPGLIDSHVHPISAAMHEFDHPIPDMNTVDDVLKYIAARAARVPEGEWISVRQVFITRLKEQRYPTRQELDTAAPKHPVVFSTGPDASLNSLALQLSGITKEFQPADDKTRAIERDESGEPTGILRNGGRYIKSKSNGKSATPDERRERLKELFAAYNAVGLTSVSDRSASDDGLNLYQELEERGELTCRLFLSMGIDPGGSVEQLDKRLSALQEHPLHAYNNRIWIRGIKVFLDGGMLTGSAYMQQPWGVSSIYSITDPQYRGLRFIDPEKLYQIARLSLKHELQPTAHAQGDAAVAGLIDAYERVNAETPLKDQRPCITHSSFMSAESVARMQRLGIVADLQPAWLFLDGATLKKQFGEERLSFFHPYKSCFDSGVKIGGGSDHMQKIGSLRSINPYNPFWGMWIAIARRPRWMESPLHAEQSLTREQAIRFYTINNAFLSFEEKEKGSLEVGKLADMVVLKTDILTCPEEAIKDIEVFQTWLGGKLVFMGTGTSAGTNRDNP